MAALSITAGNVTCATADARIGTSGEAIAAGDAIRLSSNKWYKTDADDTDKDELQGVAITAAGAADRPFVFVNTIGASINIGATTVKGAIYYAGATAGAWNPAGDLTTNWAVLPGLLARDTAGNCETIFYTPATDIIL